MSRIYFYAPCPVCGCDKLHSTVHGAGRILPDHNFPLMYGPRCKGSLAPTTEAKTWEEVLAGRKQRGLQAP